MIAARLYGREDLRIEEIPLPVPGAGEVQVRVAYAGLCGTDLHEYFGGPRATTTPHPLTGAVLPQILGHELSGTVTELGPGTASVRIGDRVCVRPIYHCGECPRCVVGLTHLCARGAAVGVSAPGGGLAGYLVVPQHLVFGLPDEVSLVRGALVEPMSTALNAVLRAGCVPGERAVVFGAGAVGHGVLLSLAALGVGEVAVVEPSPLRRAAAEALGATRTVDPAGDPVAEVLDWTGGRGVDAAFECAGRESSLAAAIGGTAAQGRLVILALFDGSVPIPMDVLRRAELSMLGAQTCPRPVFERVIELMAAGHYPAEGWVEHIPLSDVVAGLADIRDGRRGKVLVDLSSVL